MVLGLLFFFFFFNDTATTEIYTLSLHDALPIYAGAGRGLFHVDRGGRAPRAGGAGLPPPARGARSEEHTSELQSRLHLVCRLLLEKKKNRSIQAPLATTTEPDIEPRSTAQSQSR